MNPKRQKKQQKKNELAEIKNRLEIQMLKKINEQNTRHTANLLAQL